MLNVITVFFFRIIANLKAEKSSEIVREETINSSVKFDNVNMEELGMYLRQNLPAEYIMKNNLDELLPKRVSKKDKDVLKEMKRKLIDMKSLKIYKSCLKNLTMMKVMIRKLKQMTIILQHRVAKKICII